LFEAAGKPLRGASLSLGEPQSDPSKIKGPWTVLRDKNGKNRYYPLVRSGFSHPKAEEYTRIHLADWDLDGKPDLLVGDFEGAFLLYRNGGKPGEPRFGLPEEVRPGKSPNDKKTGRFSGGRPSPFLFDWDGDGRRDLLVGCERGQVWFYRNVGENRAPAFDPGEPVRARGKPIQVGYRARLCVCDWNGDGTPDLLVGNCYSKSTPGGPRKTETRGNVWLFLGKKAEREEGF
jgi:hypothetical protein